MTIQTSYQGLSGAPSFSDEDELSYRLTNCNEHQVMWYVKNLPFESTLYPANMYQRVNSSPSGRGGKHLITWSPPAHDQERRKMKGCGFIRAAGTKGADGIVHTACSSDKEHYIRSKKNHCWSLTCPVCCNDTALRMGDRVEKQLLSYKILKEKQGEEPGNLGHWVISPDQELIKDAMQTEEDYNAVKRYIYDELIRVGARGGVIVFHPWRQKEDSWEFAPHFHSILFGYLDTNSFRFHNQGWIIKKVHADEDIESISQTAAYLMTHMGIGLIEKHPEDIDWDMKFLEYMFPGLYDDYDKSKHFVEINGCRIKNDIYRWTDEDIDLRSRGKGRMCGDLGGLDWLEWTKDKLHKGFNITYFGEVNQNNFRKITIEKEIRTRQCKECGATLNIYSGLCDIHGEQAKYTFENEVKSFKRDAPIVRQAWETLKPDLRKEHTSIAKIASKTALIVSTDELRQINYNGISGND